MASIIKTVIEHPKKTIFFSSIVGYGSYYCKGKFDDVYLRRSYCKVAEVHGLEKIKPFEKARRITVLINPAAKKRKCRKLFDKNVAPLLHIAGLDVVLVETDHAGQAKEYMSALDPATTDGILVAGGDGSLLEIVTGLLRRTDMQSKVKKNIPVGVVPLGRENIFVKSEVSREENNLVSWCNSVTQLLLNNKCKLQDALEIKTEDSEGESRLVYALTGLEWSIPRSAEARRDRYWYFGPLKDRWTYVWAGLKGEYTRALKSGTMVYTPPCSGCSKCVTAVPTPQRSWLSYLIGQRINHSNAPDLSKVDNQQCGIEQEVVLAPMDGLVVTRAKDCLHVHIMPAQPTLTGFLSRCFTRRTLQHYSESEGYTGPGTEVIKCNSVRLVPDKCEGEEYIIDNDTFDAKPVEIRLMRKALKVFSDGVTELDAK